MFISHYAAAFLGKKAAPRVKLGTLLFASQFLDLLWPILLLLGLEHVGIHPDSSPFTRLNLYDYLISHSMIRALLWSVIIGSIYFIKIKYQLSALVVTCAAFSHWILDFITHNPNLPVFPKVNYFVGLGLWNSTTGTIIVESLLFLTGIIFYIQST